MEKFIHVERCDSTQDILKEQLALIGEDELTVSCEQQTNGHGRSNNIWKDSPGSVCFSMTINQHPQMTFTALEISILVHKFIFQKGKDIKLKWPNDLISPDGKKCGGILVQNSGTHYYAGIGLNLFENKHCYGEIFSAPFALDKKTWAQELSQYIRKNRYNDTELLKKDWLENCFHLNRKVKITEGDQESVGIFTGLGSYGEAVLENSQGIQHLFNGSLRLF